MSKHRLEGLDEPVRVPVATTHPVGRHHAYVEDAALNSVIRDNKDRRLLQLEAAAVASRAAAVLAQGMPFGRSWSLAVEL